MRYAVRNVPDFAFRLIHASTTGVAVAAVLVGCLALSGCSMNTEPDASLQDGRWNLVSTKVNNTSELIPASENYSIVFNADGSTVGTSACNDCSGTWTAAGDQITLSLACTEIACSPQPSFEQFPGVATSCDSFAIDGSKLYLFSVNGSTTTELRFALEATNLD